MPDNPPRNAWGSMLPATADRRTGDDRRAPVPSPVGDRWRNVADSLDSLADVSADNATRANEAYGLGQEDAYRTAARIVRAFADTEDAR